MSKKATETQRKAMSAFYRGKEIFKPLNTGWVDENIACVREWVANIFFCRKGDTVLMVDAGYNYDHLAEKMGWHGTDPKNIGHILISETEMSWTLTESVSNASLCPDTHGDTWSILLTTGIFLPATQSGSARTADTALSPRLRRTTRQRYRNIGQYLMNRNVRKIREK
jgi:hypothetical protein